MLSHNQYDDHDDVIKWKQAARIYSKLLTVCAGNQPTTAEFPSQRSVTQRFDAFFDLRLKQTVG